MCDDQTGFYPVLDYRIENNQNRIGRFVAVIVIALNYVRIILNMKFKFISYL